MNVVTLSNGLRCIHIPYANPDVSYCSLIIDVGSVNEKNSERGMAHFMEHMMFKGTAKRKSIQIISELDNVGGELNAFTTKEKTCIHASIGTQHVGKAIDLMADIVVNSIFPEKEIEKEKQIVHDEINMYLDNPEESIYDDFLESLYPGKALGKTILGSHQDVDKFSREGLLKFISNHYSPDRMVFTIFTHLPQAQVIRLLEDATESFPKNKKQIVKSQAVSKHKLFKLSKQTDFVQAHCIIGSEVCGVRSKDKFALALLNNILGGPYMNSRLSLAIREKYGFCYSIYSDLQLFKESGAFSINYATETKYIDKCRALVNVELNRICEKGITKKQFEIALQQVAGQLQLSWDNPSGMVTTLGNALLDNGKILTAKEVFETYSSLTLDNLSKIANKYLLASRQNEYIYLPSGLPLGQ